MLEYNKYIYFFTLLLLMVKNYISYITKIRILNLEHDHTTGTLIALYPSIYHWNYYSHTLNHMQFISITIISGFQQNSKNLIYQGSNRAAKT